MLNAKRCRLCVSISIQISVFNFVAPYLLPNKIEIDGQHKFYWVCVCTFYGSLFYVFVFNVVAVIPCGYHIHKTVSAITAFRFPYTESATAQDKVMKIYAKDGFGVVWGNVIFDVKHVYVQ
jgi:hypothetical protein